jgi:hypothetical protein
VIFAENSERWLLILRPQSLSPPCGHFVQVQMLVALGGKKPPNCPARRLEKQRHPPSSVSNPFLFPLSPKKSCKRRKHEAGSRSRLSLGWVGRQGAHKDRAGHWWQRFPGDGGSYASAEKLPAAGVRPGPAPARGRSPTAGDALSPAASQVSLDLLGGYGNWDGTGWKGGGEGVDGVCVGGRSRK